jgi:hypothetical protein
MALCVVSFIATLILSGVALLAPAAIIHRLNGILRACQRVANEEGLVWSAEIMGPYSHQTHLVAAMASTILLLVLLGIWWFLHRQGYGCTIEQ